MWDKPMITYATNTERWEEWMFEYRYGAFYIFPPDGVIEPIDALRRTYDPTSAAYCRAHISLSEPLQGPLTDTQIQELQTALSAMTPFDLHYDPLRSFPPYPGVVYSIQPEDKFRQLRSIVHSTSLFADAPLKRKDIPPHMTIAEFITVERTEELLDELQGNVPEGTFRCDSIEYAVPNDDFYFERVLTIPIGSAESRSGSS
jgi:2'-5' RNA ligase